MFQYYRCGNCKLIFLSPVPADLDTYYRSSYAAYQKPDKDALEATAEQERHKLDIVLNFVAGGRVLEIGPGYGGFAYLAKQSGFEVDAVEMDASCRNYLADVVGVRTFDSLQACRKTVESGSYDVVALWHVVEHLVDPWSTLRDVVNTLKPGGIIVVASPNPAALQFRLFGRFWTHVDAPRHLELIPLENLIQRMESYGLKTVLKTTADKSSKAFSSFGWWRISLNNFVKAIFPHATLKRVMRSNAAISENAPQHPAPGAARHTGNLLYLPVQALDRFRVFILRSIVSSVMKPIERIEGLGCAYTVVFRK